VQQKYKKFWGSFGKYLKVGIVEDEDNKDVLAKLVRFQSTHENGIEPVSLQSYVGRMKEGQSSVYYICADSRYAAIALHHIISVLVLLYYSYVLDVC
jgi:molecular chaperone HtpG